MSRDGGANALPPALAVGVPAAHVVAARGAVLPVLGDAVQRLQGVKQFRFVGVTLPRDRAPEAHFGADFDSLNLECIAVVCNSSFPLPASSEILPARPTHASRTSYVCLLFEFIG